MSDLYKQMAKKKFQHPVQSNDEDEEEDNQEEEKDEMAQLSTNTMN